MIRNLLFLALGTRSEPISRRSSTVSFVSALDLASYEDLSSIRDRKHFKQDCMVGCMEVVPYQFYCSYVCDSELDKEFHRRQNKERHIATTEKSTTTTNFSTSTVENSTLENKTSIAWTTAKTSTEKLATSAFYPTTTSSPTSTAVSWPGSILTESTSPKSTETLKTSTFKVFEKDNRCGISHALSISSIAGREVTSIANLLEGESSLVKKLEMLISMEMTAIVVNGHSVSDVDRHPWLVALRTKGGSHFCGGAILDQTHILTAAHCKFVLEYDRVVYKTVHRSNGHGEEVLQVARVINHPQAGRTSKGTWDYDFTILVLRESLRQYTPICLPNAGDDFSNSECILAGWGRIGTNPPHYAELLQEASSTVNSVCGPYEQLLTEASFCVGYRGKSSGCNGDSGSPLVCRNSNGGFTLAGVASWAALSCSEDTPTGFAKVTSVLEWIKNTLKEK